MQKWGILVSILALSTCCLMAWAQEVPVLAISQYQLTSDKAAAYGLFDIGNKPSLRIIFPESRWGKIKLQLHGRYYTSANTKPFSVVASFEDASGKIFQQSKKLSFTVPKGVISPSPVWFSGLDKVAGCYGSQIVEINVPVGTAVVNIMGDDNQPAGTPNQLVGYISHIQIP